jgi:AAA domain
MMTDAMIEGHERVLLAALMNGVEIRIAPEDFTSPNKIIFDTITGLTNRTLLAVTDALRLSGQLDKVGGAYRIAEIACLPTDQLNVDYALSCVLERSNERRSQRIGQALQKGDIDIPQAAAELSCLTEPSELTEPTDIIALAETDPAVFELDNLLGNRFLCIEGGMLLIGPSGIGKSSANLQQDVLWALGRPAFGIKPSRPLRILVVQAENDDGDLHEMAWGVCNHLNLSTEEREAVRKRVVYIKEKAKTGENFIKFLRCLVRKYRPDIVRIDPLHAYVGGDVRDPAVTTPFLRNGLNSILQEFRCAAIVCHHTPKTTCRDTSEWKSSDWQYAGAGNADLTNWARSIIVIEPTHVFDVFTFRAAKRGRRIGWADDDGHPVYDRLFCHHGGEAIFWRDASEEDEQRVMLAKKGQAPKTKEDLKALVPIDEPIPKNALLERARLAGFPINPTRTLLSELVRTEELYEFRIPRKGTNPEVSISRREQTVI